MTGQYCYIAIWHWHQSDQSHTIGDVHLQLMIDRHVCDLDLIQLSDTSSAGPALIQLDFHFHLRDGLHASLSCYPPYCTARTADDWYSAGKLANTLTKRNTILFVISNCRLC